MSYGEHRRRAVIPPDAEQTEDGWILRRCGLTGVGRTLLDAAGDLCDKERLALLPPDSDEDRDKKDKLRASLQRMIRRHQEG